MDWLSLFAAFLVVVFGLVCYFRRSRLGHLLPGPPGLPWLGNILQFGRHPPVTVEKWSKTYGDIMTVYDGRKPLVILSNFDAMKKAFGDSASAGRDQVSKLRYDETSHAGVGLLFSEGDIWKVHRRFALSTLRNLGMGRNSMEETIIHQVEDVCDILRATKGKPFNPKVLLSNSIANVICATIFGRRFPLTDPKFTQLTTMVSQGVDSFAVDSLACAMPFLMWFPNPVRSKLLRARKNFVTKDAYFRELIAEHDAAVGRQENDENYLSAYENEKRQGGFKALSEKDSGELQLLASLTDLFTAGTETTSTTTLWSFIFMLENPDIMARVHAEIDDKVGRNRMLTSADRAHLPFTEAVILETQRCGNLVPFVLRKTLEPIEIDGYVIPAQTNLIGNLYSIHRDPRWFNNPDKFDPLRFLDCDMNLLRPEGFAPFSVGKRVCLGEALARMELFLFIANLLRCFTLSLPPGKTISHRDFFASVVLTPLPFELIFTPRV